MLSHIRVVTSPRFSSVLCLAPGLVRSLPFDESWCATATWTSPRSCRFRRITVEGEPQLVAVHHGSHQLTQPLHHRHTPGSQRALGSALEAFVCKSTGCLALTQAFSAHRNAIFETFAIGPKTCSAQLSNRAPGCRKQLTIPIISSTMHLPHIRFDLCHELPVSLSP
jgi:hypothetical protein